MERRLCSAMEPNIKRKAEKEGERPTSWSYLISHKRNIPFSQSLFGNLFVGKLWFKHWRSNTLCVHMHRFLSWAIMNTSGSKTQKRNNKSVTMSKSRMFEPLSGIMTGGPATDKMSAILDNVFDLLQCELKLADGIQLCDIQFIWLTPKLTLCQMYFFSIFMENITVLFQYFHEYFQLLLLFHNLSFQHVLLCITHSSEYSIIPTFISDFTKARCVFLLYNIPQIIIYYFLFIKVTIDHRTLQSQSLEGVSLGNGSYSVPAFLMVLIRYLHNVNIICFNMSCASLWVLALDCGTLNTDNTACVLMKKKILHSWMCMNMLLLQGTVAQNKVCQIQKHLCYSRLHELKQSEIIFKLYLFVCQTFFYYMFLKCFNMILR